MRRNLKLAADIGGTFTDITLMLEDGSIATEKVPSTPDDYSRGIINGMTSLLRSLDLSPADVGEVLHGCTVATNTIFSLDPHPIFSSSGSNWRADPFR